MEFYLQEISFDVKAILNASLDGAKLVQKYTDPEIPVTDVDRNAIINIALGHLIKETGDYYPKAANKEKLAAAIVAGFPQMGLVRPGMPAHAYIYCSATGNEYIDQHLKRMRDVALAPEQRKRKSTEKVKEASGTKGKSLKKSPVSVEQPFSEDEITEFKIKVFPIYTIYTKFTAPKSEDFHFYNFICLYLGCLASDLWRFS